MCLCVFFFCFLIFFSLKTLEEICGFFYRRFVDFTSDVELWLSMAFLMRSWWCGLVCLCALFSLFGMNSLELRSFDAKRLRDELRMTATSVAFSI